MVAALALAVVPGALRLAEADEPLVRAVPVTLGTSPATPVSLPTVAAMGAPDLPIVPPPAELVGELAPVVEAPPPLEPARAGVPGRVMALIVGIDDYPGSGSDLNAAGTDAVLVDTALDRFGVPVDNRVLLRDGQARREQLVAALEGLAAATGPADTFVFAYAGHVRKLDSDTEAIVAADGGLITDEEVAAILARSAARRGWLLLATCYAAGFTEALAPGRVLTAAAGADSLAYESPSVDGSYLVHHLVREGWLQGQAGPSVQEAFAYADARIAQAYPNRRPVQIDQSVAPLTMGGGDPTVAGAGGPSSSSSGAAPSSSPPPSPPPSSPSTTEPAQPPPMGGPERRCSLVVFCG